MPLFHAVAVDYDGTLTESQRPHDHVLVAVDAVRAAGRTCVLVTGRILDELRAAFPEVDRHFDAIVAENGAVLSRGGATVRVLADPVSETLDAALRARGVPVRRGQVLLATDTSYGDVVNGEIGRLGLDAQIVRNRGALMVLPAGVTKGSGITEAFHVLGLSPHSAVAIGDAENDHALLDACELGIAVANAVPSIRARADMILPAADGSAVADFLLGPFLQGLPPTTPSRWHLTIGRQDDGTPVTIAASGLNVEIYGASGVGKSYIAGSIAEQLMEMRYLVCIIDLEGDHVPLAAMYGVVALGGRRALPEPAEIAELIVDGVSVIVDLSLTSESKKRDYAVALLDALRATRASHGLPHWIVVEEAHVPMPATLDGWWCHDASQTGLCIVSYRPELICLGLTARADVVITLECPGSGVVTLHDGEPLRFVPPVRSTLHMRHLHKYAEGRLPRERFFYFRNERGPTGQVAGNLPEFVGVVRHAGDDVLRHHAAGNDFSRWLGDLSRNPELTNAVRRAEHHLVVDDRSLAAALFKSEIERLATAELTGGADAKRLAEPVRPAPR